MRFLTYLTYSTLVLINFGLSSAEAQISGAVCVVATPPPISIAPAPPPPPPPPLSIRGPQEGAILGGNGQAPRGGNSPGGGGRGGRMPGPGGSGPVLPGGGRPPVGTGHGFAGARAKAAGRGRRKLPTSYYSWRTWWQCEYDSWLRTQRDLRHQRGTTKDSDTDLGEVGGDASIEPAVADRVRVLALPHLREAMSDMQATVRASAATALARCSLKEDAKTTLALLEEHLKERDALVREACILGLGMLSTNQAVDRLMGIASDDTSGRKSLGIRTSIPEETRAAAAFALGLSAARHPGLIAGSPTSALVSLALNQRNGVELKVAALASLAFAQDGAAISAFQMILADDSRHQLVRAWAASGLGRSRNGSSLKPLLRALTDRSAEVARSAAYALGTIIGPGDATSIATLLTAAESHADRGVRNLAILALGEINSPVCENALLKYLKTGMVADRTHAACALGIRARSHGDPESKIGAAIFARYKRAKNSDERSAYGIALGLTRYVPAQSRLAKDLRSRRDPKLRSSLAAAVSLIPAYDALTTLRKLADRPKDPALAHWVGMALGTLGDPEAVDLMAKSLRQKRGTDLMRSAAAVGLGYLGDIRALDTLLAAVDNPSKEIHTITRAAAISALGMLGDKDDRPLLSRMRSHCNWFAMTPNLHRWIFRL